MHKNKLHNLETLKKRRKQLRSEMTPAEAFLWTRLSNGKLDGRKFRRQHSIGNYVVDFYCPSEKLSVELDGMPHFTERTEYLASLRIKEIRFENAEVFEMTDEVLAKIKACFKNE